MKKFMLHVQARPVSLDEDVLKEFNRWYDEVHLPEVLAIEGFVTARRYTPAEDEDPYITQYELEGDPEAVIGRLLKAAADGELNMSETLRMEPRPWMAVYELANEQQQNTAS
ncbi:DUF4286 family protein [Actinomadura sp. 7K507]|uniref:DUF4286 family protein n=1 Tax=Actinomadura sp. 7K507 TaxID=2530365 RepID=UPI00104BE62A|nr:DUF4286 family protein [Actinomadura sp. 7K507]TDC88539.1 hypothetical protein E1285_18070 [Actinomadura sp. 7K507]